MRENAKVLAAIRPASIRDNKTESREGRYQNSQKGLPSVLTV